LPARPLLSGLGATGEFSQPPDPRPPRCAAHGAASIVGPEEVELWRTSSRKLAEWMGGPTLLVGHSYGGAVITGAGHATNVVGLVYIAFAPDEGESPNSILARTDPSPGVAGEDRTGEPAWKTKSSWYQVSAQDRMIPPGRLIAEADTVRAAVDLCGEGDGGHHWSVPACISVRTVRSVRDMASTCCFSSIWRGFRNRPKLSGDCPRTVSGRFWTVRDFTNFRPVRAGQRHFLDGLDASDGYTV
jgi:pimeloyl-ACP methyl ester carboxylesterase